MAAVAAGAVAAAGDAPAGPVAPLTAEDERALAQRPFPEIRPLLEPPDAAARVWTAKRIGWSAGHRRIRVTAFGHPSARPRVLVLGCTSTAPCRVRRIERALVQSGCPPPDADIWIVPDLNPDRSAAPDMRLAARLILRLRPDTVVWADEHPEPWQPLTLPRLRTVTLDPDAAGPRRQARRLLALAGARPMG
jgi:hypothetical protein